MPDRDLFTYEADMVATNIADRQAPAMTWDDSLGNIGCSTAGGRRSVSPIHRTSPPARRSAG